MKPTYISFDASASKNGMTFLVLLMATMSSSVRSKEETTYYYTDPQGTVLATANEKGDILMTSDHRPYGEQVLGISVAGPGYTGHLSEPESGLVYMQARYFDPGNGRFLAVDPSAPKPGDIFAFNRFAYARNSPLVHVDPDGKVAIVTQMKDGGVRVQYPTTFIGPEATPEHVAAIKDQIGAMSGVYSVHGKQTSVIFEVTEISTKLFGSTPHRARNEVKLVSGKTSQGDGRSYAELGGKRAEIDVTDRLVKDGVAPHEFSHLGGVDDLYDKTTGQPDPAKGDSIMNRVPGRIDSDTVQGIIDYKGNVQRTE